MPEPPLRPQSGGQWRGPRRDSTRTPRSFPLDRRRHGRRPEAYARPAAAADARSVRLGLSRIRPPASQQYRTHRWPAGDARGLRQLRRNREINEFERMLFDSGMGSQSSAASNTSLLLRAVCTDELQFEQDIRIRAEARWKASSHLRTTKPLTASLRRRTRLAATERRRVQQTQTRQYTPARLDAKALHYPGGVGRSVFERGRGWHDCFLLSFDPAKEYWKSNGSASLMSVNRTCSLSAPPPRPARTVDAPATRARANGRSLLVVADFLAPPRCHGRLRPERRRPSARQAAPSSSSYWPVFRVHKGAEIQ